MTGPAINYLNNKTSPALIAIGFPLLSGFSEKKNKGFVIELEQDKKKDLKTIKEKIDKILISYDENKKITSENQKKMKIFIADLNQYMLNIDKDYIKKLSDLSKKIEVTNKSFQNDSYHISVAEMFPEELDSQFLHKENNTDQNKKNDFLDFFIEQKHEKDKKEKELAEMEINQKEEKIKKIEKEFSQLENQISLIKDDNDENDKNINISIKGRIYIKENYDTKAKISSNQDKIEELQKEVNQKINEMSEIRKAISKNTEKIKKNEEKINKEQEKNEVSKIKFDYIDFLMAESCHNMKKIHDLYIQRIKDILSYLFNNDNNDNNDTQLINQNIEKEIIKRTNTSIEKDFTTFSENFLKTEIENLVSNQKGVFFPRIFTYSPFEITKRILLYCANRNIKIINENKNNILHTLRIKKMDKLIEEQDKRLDSSCGFLKEPMEIKDFSKLIEYDTNTFIKNEKEKCEQEIFNIEKANSEIRYTLDKIKDLKYNLQKKGYEEKLDFFENEKKEYEKKFETLINLNNESTEEIKKKILACFIFESFNSIKSFIKEYKQEKIDNSSKIKQIQKILEEIKKKYLCKQYICQNYNYFASEILLKFLENSIETYLLNLKSDNTENFDKIEKLNKNDFEKEYLSKEINNNQNTANNNQNTENDDTEEFVNDDTEELKNDLKSPYLFTQINNNPNTVNDDTTESNKTEEFNKNK